MGQKVSPIGLRVGVIRDWNLDGMLTKIMPIYYWKMLKFVNSYSLN